MAGAALSRRRVATAAVTVEVGLALTACRGGSGSGADSAVDTPASVTAPGAPATVALPPANGPFDDQIGGPYPPDPSVQVVDRDRSADPVPGRYTICYVNAYQSQPDEKAFWFDRHPDLQLRLDGEPVSDPGWPGEYLFDLTTAAAHAAGLAIGQKNGADLGTKGRDAGFDFAIAEECQVYDECGAYTDVYGGRVYEIEYTDGADSAFSDACADHGARIAVILRDREVVPRGDTDYVYGAC